MSSRPPAVGLCVAGAGVFVQHVPPRVGDLQYGHRSSWRSSRAVGVEVERPASYAVGKDAERIGHSRETPASPRLTARP
jgi:hypothetical protein